MIYTVKSLSLLLYFSTISLGQWCCIDTNLIISDLETQTLRFQISGASKNDLSDTAQGICGIRLKFEHEFVGDLTAQLLSPGGQSIQLMGSIGKSGATKFSKWNVTFVPCQQQAVPDPGFKQKWSNLQAWGILGSFFNGTYYPFSGCLEDFNTGTVDGTWTLILKDNDLFYSGKLEQFCILFCDNSGINCNTCNANGGYFEESDLEICNNDPQLNLNIKIFQPNFIPDFNIYGYKYFIVQNDIIVEIKDKLDVRSYTPGDYSICGISYLLADSSKLPSIGSGNKFSNFRNNVVSGQANMCAEMSKNCLNLKILPVVPPTNLNITVCSKDTFRIGNKSFTKSGVYREVLTSSNGCDSVINLELTVHELNAVIKVPDDINCMNSNVILDLTSSSFTSNTIIHWSTPNGNIVDSTDLQKIVVNKKGIYKAVLVSSNCIDSAEVEVMNNGNVPELEIIIDTIDCNKPVITAKATTDISNAIWLWKDELNSTLGIEDSLRINKAGKYLVIVSDQAGCTNKIAFEIKEDIEPPMCNLFATELSCRVDSAVLSFTSSSSVIFLEWRGPGPYISNDSTTVVKEQGLYTLTAKSSNGCISKTDVQVISTATKPEFSYTVDTLTCKDSVVQLIPLSTDHIQSIEYYVSGIFSSVDLKPLLRKSGRYNVRLIDTAECVLDTFVEVFEDKRLAEFQLNTGILGCAQDSILISLRLISDTTLQYNYSWSGPIGFSSNLKEPYVRQRGKYYVTVILQNGCEIKDSIEVKEDTMRPRIDLYADSLSCLKKTAYINSSVNTKVLYSWSGPNNYVSSDSSLVISEPGFYKVTVTSANGCSSERVIQVILDTILPFNNILGDTLTCTKMNVRLNPNYSGPIDSIYWKFNQQFYSLESNPVVNRSGIYALFAIGLNGCVFEDSIEIVIDTSTLPISILKDSITCKNKSITIDANFHSPDIIYKYISPSLDTFLTQTLFNQTSSGVYQLFTTNRNGCIHYSTVLIEEFTTPTKVDFAADTLSCLKDSSYIHSLSNDPNLNYKWKFPNGTNNNGSNFFSRLSGDYIVTVTNEFGCEFVDSITVISKILAPKVSISDSVINCITKVNPFVEFSTSDSLNNFFWTDPLNNILTTKRINFPYSGLYILEATNLYGCKYKDSVFVQYDTLNPIFTNVNLDTFNCEKKLVSSRIMLLDTNATYQWSGPGAFRSKELNPIFPIEGKYTLKIINKNFCSLDTSFDLILDTIRPQISIVGDTIDCINPIAELEVFGVDSNVMIKWTSPTGSSSNVNPLKVSTGGLYSVEVILDRNRCAAKLDYEILVDTVPPSLSTIDYFLICTQDSIQIKALSSCPDGKFIWTTPTGKFIEVVEPFIYDTGTYHVNVICQNHCSATDSLQVNHLEILPTVQFDSIDILSCKNATVTIHSTFGRNDTIFSWFGPNNFTSKDANPVVDKPGDYHLRLQNNYGCFIDTVVKLRIDTAQPFFQLEQLDSFQCNKNTVRIGISNLSTGSGKISWSTSNGLILSATNNEITVGKNGDYVVQIVDTSNGCQAFKKYRLQDSINQIIDAKILANDITCPNLKDGSIEVLRVIGGESPYTYSMNNSLFTSNPTFTNLSSGKYFLSIKDKNLCSIDTTIEIQGKGPYLLEIIKDSTINLGEKVQLVISTNMVNIQKVKWNPTLGLSCSSCLNPMANPIITTEYQLTLTDSNQCEVEDLVLIKVLSNQEIFVPNVFSPNHDGINDILDIKVTPGIKTINFMSVFDRWGNRIYHQENFDPNLGNNGWNGEFKGVELNPGVYVYTIQATNIKGELIQKYGEITLLR